MFLLVPAHPGSPGQRAVKQLLYNVSDSISDVDTAALRVESLHNVAVLIL